MSGSQKLHDDLETGKEMLTFFRSSVTKVLSVTPVQCARTETTHGCKLPAFDGHAHSQDVLLHQPGSGHVPLLPYRDPEDHLQPGHL